MSNETVQNTSEYQRLLAIRAYLRSGEIAGEELGVLRDALNLEAESQLVGYSPNRDYIGLLVEIDKEAKDLQQ